MTKTFFFYGFDSVSWELFWPTCYDKRFYGRAKGEQLFF